VHGCGGFFGTVMLGALAEESVCNCGVHRSGELFLTQLVAAIFTAVYSMIVTFLILKIMQLVVRVKPTEQEMAALDIAIHGEVAYKLDMSEVSPKAASQMGSPTKKAEEVAEPAKDSTYI
jgi:Amt family ammonium transporter